MQLINFFEKRRFVGYLKQYVYILTYSLLYANDHIHFLITLFLEPQKVEILIATQIAVNRKLNCSSEFLETVAENIFRLSLFKLLLYTDVFFLDIKIYFPKRSNFIIISDFIRNHNKQFRDIYRWFLEYFMKVIMTYGYSLGSLNKYHSLLNCSATFIHFPNIRRQTQSFKKRRKKICSFNTQIKYKKHTSNSSDFKNCSIFRIFTIALYLTTIPTVKATSFHTNFKYGETTVKTKYGLLRGIIVRSSPVVEAYLGIPYASPPIGSLRYMPPITPSSWKNVRNADRFSPVCPQTVPMPPNGPEALLEVPRARLIQFRRLFPLLSNQSEDCLYLNMYIPKTSSNNNNEYSCKYTLHFNAKNTFSIYLLMVNGFNSVVHCSVSLSIASIPGVKSFQPKASSYLYSTELYIAYLGTESASGMNIGKTPWISKRLSSLVFIQGESYEWNSGNPYDGSELAAQGNIIVVTINFRLGILGFLKTGGKESAQGNFGLMDLVAGLHWLKENLPAFGGDSNQITIMGHGTGAALANILLVSPVSNDLLQRGILISGSALSPWAIQKYPLYVKRRVAEQTGCHGDLLYDDLAPCLRTKKLSDLLAVKIDYARFLSGFAPFVDGTVIQPNIGDSHTLKLPVGSAIVSSSGIEFANFPKQDLLFGLTSVESYLDLSAQDLEYGLNETHKDRILRTYVRNVFDYHLNEIFAVLKNEYTDWERATRNPFSSRDATLAFLSDGHTASHLIKIGHMHSLRGGRSYFLHFRHKTSEEEYPLRSGSVHGEDIPFWFGLPISPLFPKNYSSEERKLSLAMVQYLSNFVKTGNPNQSTTYLNKENGTENNFIDEPKNNFSESNISKNSSAFRIRSIQASHSSTLLNFGSNLTEKALRKRRSNPKMKRNMDKEKIGKSTKHKRHPSSESIIYDNRSKIKKMIQDFPHWEVFDSVNQLYLELGHNAEVHSHYRGHKLSMWLNLIPQLHKHSNLKDLSMGHHQFVDEDTKFYEGIVRGHLQMKPLDDETEYSLYTEKSTVGNRKFKLDTKILDQNDVTTDCTQNNTQFPMLTEPTPLYNIPNISDSFFNVMENMDVIRRLSGRQLQSYTTALVATVAVGCFLLILNILIFAAIYHQREKRSMDSKKKEKMEDGEIYMNQTSTKNTLHPICSETPGKELLDEKNIFDQNIAHVLDNDNERIIKEKTWVYTANTIDLLDVKHASSGVNESTTIARHSNDYFDTESNFNMGKNYMSLENAFSAQPVKMSYQPIDGFSESKQEIVIQGEDIPMPPPPPKSLCQGGILRVTGSNHVSSSNKKRVHIQEISV